MSSGFFFVPTGTHGTTLRQQGEILCLVDYVEQSADPATSIVHFIQHGNGQRDGEIVNEITYSYNLIRGYGATY